MHSLKNCNASIHVSPIQVKKTNTVTTREAPCVPLHHNPPAGPTQHPTLHLIVMSSCSPQSVIVPHSLSFTTLIFLKSAGRLLCRTFLSLGLSEVSQWLGWGYTFFGKNPTESRPSRCIPSLSMLSSHLIDHLMKVASSDLTASWHFSFCK